MSKAFTYHLVVGWAENRWKTHQFLKGLEKAGGLQIDNPRKADLIITHSAGGHINPNDINPKLIAIVAPCYLPEQSFLVATAKEWVMDCIYYFRHFLFISWLKKNLYYLFFGLAHPRRTYSIYKQVIVPLDLSSLKRFKVTLIRNHNDFFCSEQILNISKQYSNISFYELPGRHDDLWVNPQPYINLILRGLK
ncbi:MAG TPA: hypothetical protein VFB03_00255 [Candidatus Saccharimonadales bacterium]|nr:hypothetical protein [Candidatus Saccharimonadales bacterium]